MYPALSVLQALSTGDEAAVRAVGNSTPGSEVSVLGDGDGRWRWLQRRCTQRRTSQYIEYIWIGGERGMEVDLVKREGVPFEAIPAAGVHGVGGRALPGNLNKLAQGFRAARRILGRFRPDVLLFTGGYVAVPMALAAHFPLKGLPRPHKLVYVPDIEPGLALKLLVRLADVVAVTVEDSKNYLPRRSTMVVTGYPVRAGLKRMERSEACQSFELDPELPVFLVLGGSKGARSINRAFLAVLPQLLAEMQVIHLSGQLDWQEVEQARQSLSPEQMKRYRAFAYLHEEMGAALSAADLALSRAGASSLGELPLFGLPAILVPYPYAWRYQHVNAEYLVQRGAAVMLKDADLPVEFFPLVKSLMFDMSRRQGMRQAMSALARPEAARTIAGILFDMVAGPR